MAEAHPRDPSEADASGAHACFLWNDHDEYIDVLARTLERSSAHGRRILWIGREPDAGPFLQLLHQVEPRTADGPLEREELRGPELRVVDESVAVTSEGGLDRSVLIDILGRETVRALDDGYLGLQVIQEMDGWVGEGSDPAAVVAYETALGTFLPGSSCSVLCTYHRSRCRPELLLSLLEVHTHVMVDGAPWENVYAIPPQDLLALDVPEATLRRRLANLSEHRASEMARRSHTSLVELLHDIVWAGHEASTLDEVVGIVLDRLATKIDWPLGHWYRLDEEDGRLVPSGVWSGGDGERFARFMERTESTRLPPGTGLPGLAAETRKPVWIVDCRRDSRFSRVRADEDLDVRSAFAVPVTSNDRVKGVLEFFSPVPRPEDPSLLRVLGQGAAQIFEVLERKEAENELLLLESAVSQLREAILVLTPDFTNPEGPVVEFANPAIEAISGRAAQEVEGLRTGFLFGPKTDDIVRRRARRDLSEGQSVGGEVIAYRKDGTEFVLKYHVSPIRDREGGITHLVAIFRDVTDERRAEDAIRRADHDSLTGLPNRDLFMRRLERSVERARTRPGERFAVLFLDLDRFKVVNDSLGHLRGDQLLVALAHRLEHIVRPDDTVARFGGDEIVVLMDRVESVEDVTQVAHRIEQELKSPFVVGNRTFYTTASIGIALSDTGYALPEDVLRDADAAMYRAKARGGGTYEVFDRSLYDDAVSVLRLETELHRAVERGDFELRYQPIVSLDDSRTRGFEALLRWNHPERGLLEPSEFLGLAEETGLIVPIGHWVLDEAGRQLHAWQERYDAAAELSLSVNLSPREFGSDRVVLALRKVLHDHSFIAGTLQVEITENALIERPERVESILHELREMGISVCLDDFGTGYSSLRYLQRFPVKVLKIDRHFTRGLTNGTGPPKRNEEIVRAILALARNLELDVTAEGVENRRQLRRLREMSCPNAQGFYFSRPLRSTEVEDLLQRMGATNGHSGTPSG